MLGVVVGGVEVDHTLERLLGEPQLGGVEVRASGEELHRDVVGLALQDGTECLQRVQRTAPLDQHLGAAERLEPTVGGGWTSHCQPYVRSLHADWRDLNRRVAVSGGGGCGG